jgi:hypothetical protein
MVMIMGCASQSLEDYREEGEGIARQITYELRHIRSRDDLLVHSAKLHQLFNALVDVMIHAQEFKDRYPQAEFMTFDKKEQPISDQLRIELNRVLHLEGGREVIEKAQEEALNRLDRFAHSRASQ